jgi:streptogramin lyase
MDDPGRRRRRVRAWTVGALSVLSSLLPAATAPAAEEPTIFTLASAMHAVGTTIGPDGNLWFAASSSSDSQGPGAVGRIDPDGKVVEFRLEEKSGARAITSGPDGALWFTELRADRIGRVTLDGTITTFPLPSADSQPLAIVLGADGGLWFTEYAGGRIGRISPAGEITEFPLESGSKPVGIAAGPEGNLWFTEYGADRIGRITPDGQITEFSLPGDDRRPTEIVVGPDGNLWFVYDGSNRIGRITPSGEVAEFPIPVLGGAQTIAAGPDGNLWFSFYGQIGALAPNGRPALLACLKASCRLPALSLTFGTDGEMWAGTSVEYPAYGGGGGYITTTLTQPGYIARFSPRATTTELTSGARPARGRHTYLTLRCGSAAGCHGTLRLNRQRAAFPGESGVNSTVVPVGRGRYDLAAGEQASVFVGLNHKAGVLLAKGRFTAWALAEAEGGDLETARLVSLRRGGAGGSG